MHTSVIFIMTYNDLGLTTILFQLPTHPPSRKNRLCLVLRWGGVTDPKPTATTSLYSDSITLNYYIYYICLTPLFQDSHGKLAPDKQNHSGKTCLDLLMQEIVSGSGISWAICKSAPHSRQITMPVPHHSDHFALSSTYSDTCTTYLLLLTIPVTVAACEQSNSVKDWQ